MNNEFETALDLFVLMVQGIMLDEMGDRAPQVSVDPRGKRYLRIVRGDGVQRSVYCFVERDTGDIYKAAGWKAPAKGVRGSIFSEDRGQSICTPYGCGYRRY